jgi:hypothetical protein
VKAGVLPESLSLGQLNGKELFFDFFPLEFSYPTPPGNGFLVSDPICSGDFCS